MGRPGGGEAMGRRGGVYAFGNNKGGSGKSTLLFQLACSAARADPAGEVLVVDLSLYSDATTLLMGGTARPQVLAASDGAQAALDATRPATRAEGLLRALAAGEEQAKAEPSGFFSGGWNPFKAQAGAGGAKALDLFEFSVAPHASNPAIPENLRVIASCGKLPLEEGEWQAAAERLSEALAALPETCQVYFDTDHLAAAPVSKMAFACANKIVLPMSLDDNDFSRMFIDPTGNSIWGVMQELQDKGLLRAKVWKLVFNRVTALRNEKTEHEGIDSPFTPARACLDQMDAICRQLFECYNGSGFQLFYDGGEVATQRQFNEKYVTAFRSASETTMNIAKLSGSPFCSLKAQKMSVGKVVCDLSRAGLQIEALQQGVQDILKIL